MLGGRGVDVAEVEDTAADAVVVLAAEGTGVRVVGVALGVVLSELDAAAPLL